MTTSATSPTTSERLDAVIERLERLVYGETTAEKQKRLERERRRASFVVIQGGHDDA